MSYNPRSGNPFAQNDPNKEWTGNNLILQDANLRQRAGVTMLDSDVAELYSQDGGAATGAPFTQHTGSKKGVFHQLGGYPHGYFDKSKKW
jgi:hypothetical protein